MDPAVSRYLDELYTESHAHDAGEPDRLRRWRNVEPETARFMSVLIRALRPRRLLELGTSNGYSTIWLAEAARAVGAQLLSVEIDPARTAIARRHLHATGLSAELRTADAADVLAGLADASTGFVFLDAERPAYSGYWRDLRRILAPDGLLLVDNVISHAGEVAEFRATVDGDPALAGALVPIGAGVLLLTREP